MLLSPNSRFENQAVGLWCWTRVWCVYYCITSSLHTLCACGSVKLNLGIYNPPSHKESPRICINLSTCLQKKWAGLELAGPAIGEAPGCPEFHNHLKASFTFLWFFSQTLAIIVLYKEILRFLKRSWIWREK